MKTNQNFTTMSSVLSVLNHICVYTVYLFIGMVWSCGDSVDGNSIVPSITITPSSVTLNVNETNDFIVTLNNFANDEDMLIAFDNGDPDIISLTYYSNEESYLNENKTNFRVIAISKTGGTAAITASSGNGITSSVTITVNPEVSKIILSETNITMDAGTTTNIIAQTLPTNANKTTLTWTSSNDTVAAVSDGLITALSRGTTTITASNVSGVTASVAVTVIQPATNIILSTHSVTLDVGETTLVTANIFPSNVNNTNVIWTSSNSSIAVVTNGVVTGVSLGVVTITAATEDGEYSAQASINVGTPKNFSYQGVGCPFDRSQLFLNWNSVAGATSYQVYKNKNLEGSPTTNNLTLAGLTNGIHSLEVKACDEEKCSDLAALTITVTNKDFAAIILSGSIPSDLASYDQPSRDIFSTYPAGAAVMVRYVKENGTGEGSSYANAAGNVRSVLNGITDASASNVYAVLTAPGTYNAGSEISMKNNVAIVGRQCLPVGGGNTVTALSGGGTHRVFNNNNITNTAVLYGVTITNGYTTGSGGGMYNSSSSPVLTEVTLSENNAGYGGGMNNSSSSPILTRVTFSGNTSIWGGGIFNSYSSPLLNRVTLSGNWGSLRGGGMYNFRSSPILTGVTFSGNTADYGGGIYNQTASLILTGVTFSGNTANYGGGIYSFSSSPILTRVTLSGNTANALGGGMGNYYSSPILTEVTLSGNAATNGGGMYNDNSSPILTGVTLFENTATNGGGMYNQSSSPILTGVTLAGNRATNGGGMYNNNNGQADPYLVNTIIWGNTATTGKQIYLNNNSSGQENLHLYHSVVQDGLPEGYISGTTVTNFNGGGFASSTGTNLIAVYFSNIITTDPNLAALDDNGGGILTHAIPSTSSAVNQGVYVRRSAAPTGTGCPNNGANQCDTYTYYYSTDNNNWYSDLTLTTTATPPTDAIDLTATDATGRNRSGKPDIGAYEAR